MRIVIDVDGQRHALDLTGYADSATLGELVSIAGGQAFEVGTQLYVDASPVAPDAELRDLVILEGSIITTQPCSERSRPKGWSVSLAGGLEVGDAVAIPDYRELIVGRSPHADIVVLAESASWNHCTLRREGDAVRIRDSGSTNGTQVDGQLLDPEGEGELVSGPVCVVLGGAVLTVLPGRDEPLAPPPGSLPNLTGAGTAPFNRPPRPARAASVGPVSPPSPREVGAVTKFNVITVVVPLVVAGVMAMVMGDARFALFAALSPIMGIGMWFEQKHRRNRTLAAEDQRFEAALAEFRAEVEAAAALERVVRQESYPDPVCMLRRGQLPTTLLWQRRPRDDDFLALHGGVGDVPWQPEIGGNSAPRLDSRVTAVLDETRLVQSPVPIDLTGSGVVGIVGDRVTAIALARSLVLQATSHCGPADLTVGVFCDQGRESDWSWACWLPHTRQVGGSGGTRWMSAGRDRSVAVLRVLQENIDALSTPAVLLVIDSENLTEGRDAPARELLGHGRIYPQRNSTSRDHTQVSGIVIADTVDQLPASCTTVVEVGLDAAAIVTNSHDASRVDDVIIAGVGVVDAEVGARALAHFDDPELVVPGAALPSLIRLPELVTTGTLDAEAVLHLWKESTGIATPIGVGESGSFFLDLVKDGPHGLVGGTTGSGKSEFLRSLVAGLAACNDPTRLNFILVDFKGGAAFTACERLPHTIGTISNLDEQLADRAIRSLEAEMQRRQRLFAAAGEDIDNLDAYMATKPEQPLPRLLLVIDEFAMLAKDFPDVLASLVSVGAVGRTLGVHMILATQRPAGVVNDDILANTNLRVALRVQSRDDSSSVIGVPSAASIGRAQTGRAYIKLGQDDITPVQTALVTGRSHQGGSRRIETNPLDVFGVPVLQPLALDLGDTGNDLDDLIDSVVAANAQAGYPPPRVVWPEALGESVSLEAIDQIDGQREHIITVALTDEPDQQRQTASGWDLRQGNLLLMGITGSGTSTTLSSIALQAAAAYTPDELDILCLEVGSRDLSWVADLPHTIAYAGSGTGSREKQTRFLRYLSNELARRRATEDPRRVLVLIDGFVSLREEFQDYTTENLLNGFYLSYSDGPAVGMFFACSTTRAKAIPPAMDEVTTQKWLYRLADPHDYASFNVRGTNVPAAIPGRFVDTTTVLQGQVGVPKAGFRAAARDLADQYGSSATKRDVIGTLPATVTVTQLGVCPTVEGEPWLIPVGVREDTLGPACLEIFEGENVLIAGPARSGKSTLLLALAESLNAVGVLVWGIHDRRSPLGSAGLSRKATRPGEISALIASLRMEKHPVVLLVDDAERVDDADHSLAGLIAQPPRGVVVVAAARGSDLIGNYSHWANVIRKTRCGVLLQPDPHNDGQLLSVNLPKFSAVELTPGRGYLCVGGDAALIQGLSPSLN